MMVAFQRYVLIAGRREDRAPREGVEVVSKFSAKVTRI